MKQAKITKVLEDGTIEETFIDIPEKSSKSVKSKRKSSRKTKDENEDNTKQEEKQTPSTSKASIKIT